MRTSHFARVSRAFANIIGNTGHAHYQSLIRGEGDLTVPLDHGNGISLPFNHDMRQWIVGILHDVIHTHAIDRDDLFGNFFAAVSAIRHKTPVFVGLTESGKLSAAKNLVDGSVVHDIIGAIELLSKLLSLQKNKGSEGSHYIYV